MIHPEFFTDELMCELSDSARLVFAGLWLMADRAGRLVDSPRYVDGTLFPLKTRAKNCSTSRALRELQAAGRIVRYETPSGKYIQIVNFLKHQHIHPKEKPSKVPGQATDSARKSNGRDPSTSTSTSTGAESAPVGRGSDPGTVPEQDQPRRPAPVGRAPRAASATVAEQLNPEGAAAFRKHFG